MISFQHLLDVGVKVIILMDIKRYRAHLSTSNPIDHRNESVSRGVAEKKSVGFFMTMKLVGMIFTVLITVSVIYLYGVPSWGGVSGFAKARSLEMKAEEVRYPPVDVIQESVEEKDFKMGAEKGSEYVSSHKIDSPKDKHLGGLLAAGFEKASCLSRYQSFLYRKTLPHKPSSYLLSSLRKYEALHKHCGPYTTSYNKTMEQLKSKHNNEPLECNYVVWISFSGLGNRILTIASAFLYALLTNRVLLVDRGTDIADLFCEPFPETSWLLTVDFPLKQLNSFNKKSSHSYGNMLKNNVINNSTSPFPPFLYLHLVHDYSDYDKHFFCDQDQILLHKVPWLIMKTDNYFVPSLFLVPSFEQELSKLFPEKDTVFHHLGHYLFHPSNPVWGLITRFYHAYIEKVDERVGIQIRIFETGNSPFQHILDQILACSLKGKVLPKVNVKKSIIHPSGNQKSKAVLITSLNAGYFEKIRNMYWEHPTVSGEMIGVNQPSHEEYQQSEKKMHNQRAWAEMYLLSLTDVLITSSWSTFGYVAQGLGGLKPWILYKAKNKTTPDPPCQQVMSIEPCFHAPPFYDCKAKTWTDTGAIVPHIKHCEDMSWGVKLVNHG
ncbi:galactoside 2-alpha-L-fucosyltransferase-like isoform X2 [Macadamia integrifolia]|uniref:galactoside 2-alpha-L-fucosyltransferase-like isoform X2 n=1 Tax=Macadamia integrifolia TaxID=60698 RepID=UPI001C4FB6C5|nr:galactoside 2-alpha-L-fucosyltransferase-like isoform X2 [Macadamia integrifolia]